LWTFPSLLHLRVSYSVPSTASSLTTHSRSTVKMKSFAVILAAAGVALAQDPSTLPACGQTCVSNMLGIATSQFGCAAGDIVCYCSEPNFGYGVRDCSNESCSAEDAAKVISFGTEYCASALASATGASASAVSTGALGILSSAAATATASGGDSQTTLATTTTGGDAASSAGSAIASATGSAASAASSIESSAASVASSAASAASSALASLSSELSSVTGSLASGASSAIASATGSGSSGAPASTGGAAMVTGFPLAGAAGMAAWLLL